MAEQQDTQGGSPDFQAATARVKVVLDTSEFDAKREEIDRWLDGVERRMSALSLGNGQAVQQTAQDRPYDREMEADRSMQIVEDRMSLNAIRDAVEEIRDGVNTLVAQGQNG